MKNILNIIKDSNYSFSLFDQKLVDKLENKITLKDGKPYVVCAIRNKEIVLKPEEVVRQLYAMKLLEEYGYPKQRIKFEHAIHFGREVKSADIVVFDKDRPTVEYIIVEIKKPKLQDGKNQLRSYTNATGAPIAVWTNGGQISHYNRKDPNYFEDITDIPKADQTLEDILKERFTLKDLIIKDKIPNEGKSLKTIIQEMEDEVLANAGVDVFEEVFKLIFTKLYDERKSARDKEIINYFLNQKDFPIIIADKPRVKYGESREKSYDELKENIGEIDDSKFRVLEFRNTGQSEGELKKKIQKLFDEAKAKWPGVFDEASQIQLSPSHLSVSVSSLQDIKLFNSNLQIIDEAFEYLVNKSSKGEKGQYFTPRHVIDMCVKMLNPKAGEYMVDTAAGSCGFTVHTIFQITGHLFQNTDISEEEKENVLKVFGIDFDEKVVRVARTLDLIAGDGNTNVLHLNNLDYERWNETIQNRDWLEVYGAGLKRLEALQKDKSSYKEFNFDILMANPPFAGDIKESRIIHKYDLGYNDKNKPKSKVGRDILFIERNLNFLKPGGRMAIVLPQGRFNNTSDKAIREYIAEKGRIFAVVGLHVNTFKPHTGTKTSVLFVQKWDDKLCQKVDDYPIYFAVSEKSGKDNSGDYVFVKNGSNQPKLDKNGHLVINHDLHNHDGELPDGVAEKFIEWAKSEKLSFWKQVMDKKYTNNDVLSYLSELYRETKDTRLADQKVQTKIIGLIKKGSIITNLSVSDLLAGLDFKPKDLTIEVLEAFLAELRSIFWLQDFGFIDIQPLQAGKKSSPDFTAKYKNNTCAIEVFCLTQAHGQQKDSSLGVYKNFDPQFEGSKFGRDFISKVADKKKQLGSSNAGIKVLLCVINSDPIIRLNTSKEIQSHAKLLYDQLNWGNGYYVGILTGVVVNGIPSDTIYPKIS